MIIKIQVSEERNMCQLRLLVQEKAHGFQSNQMLKSRLHNFEQFIYVSQTSYTYPRGYMTFGTGCTKSHCKYDAYGTVG